MERKIIIKHGKTIKVRGVTTERLDKLRHKGQSYDGVIAELIDYFKRKEKETK